MIGLIYYRDESGQITTTDAKDWTARAYLDAHPHLQYTTTETPLGWPDAVINWYAIDGADCGTERATGFPVTDHWRLIKHVLHQRERAGLSPVHSARFRDMSVFALTEIAQLVAMARSQAQVLRDCAADGQHAIEMADGELIADQDWQGERTEWGFPDGSLLIAEGAGVWAESRACKNCLT